MRVTLVAAGVGLVLGALAIGPGLAPGFVLSYDMVVAPDPAFSKATFGLTGTLPRHVPSDTVVTALAQVVPADLVQKAVLLSVFVMACASATALVPSPRLPPRLAAGVAYAWNPYVAERLALGHWALLLGYAALPWVVRAAARGEPRRLALALIPATVGGFAALAITGLTALIVASAGAWHRREGAAMPLRTLVLLAAASLPWLVPSLLRPSGVPADPAGVAAFAARADTPFGTLGSLLALGGTWNREIVPPGYGAALTATVWLAVVVVAAGCYGVRRPYPGLGIAAGAGFALAALGPVVPGLLRPAIAMWPGFAVLRDGQQYVAPLAVLVAAGFGLAVDRLPRAELGLLAAVLPLALLPGAAGRLHAVDYPRGWARARAVVDGDAVVLPWETYRSYPWNGGRRSLDALPRYLRARVILSDAVRVGGAGEVAAEDPRARALDPLVRSGGPLTDGLRRAGIRYVVIDAHGASPNLAGAERVVDDRQVAVYRLPPAPSSAERSIPVGVVAGYWLVTFGAFLWFARISITTLIPRSSPSPSPPKEP